MTDDQFIYQDDLLPITVGPVEIVQTTDDHLEDFWRILQAWPSFWADQRIRPTSIGEFKAWWRRSAKDSLTGLDAGRVVGAGYLDAIHPGYWAYVNIFKERGYLSSDLVAAIMRGALPHFFLKYDLEKIIGVTRVTHTPCIALLQLIGLRVDGLLRHHRQVDGVWTDYVIATMLRGEIEWPFTTTASSTSEAVAS